MQQHYLPMGTTAVLSMALLFFALYCQERQISDGNATGGAGLDFLMEFDNIIVASTSGTFSMALMMSEKLHWQD